MKTKIKVSFNIKFRIDDFEIAGEEDGLEIDVEYKDEKELSKKIEKWEDFIQNKVLKAAFRGANKFVEMKNEIKAS